MSKTVTGIFHSSKSAYGFLTPDESFAQQYEGDIFIPAHCTSTATDGDRVSAVVSESFAPRPGKSYEGSIIRVEERANSEVVGVFRQVRRRVRNKTSVKSFVFPQNTRLCFDISISPKNKGEAKDYDLVLCEILEYPSAPDSRPARGRIKRIYGTSGSRGANYLCILESFNIRTEFDAQTVAEAEEAAHAPLCVQGRRDLRAESIFTIDGADAKDLDDAISVSRDADGYTLGVHIADVSHYVRAGSLTDTEAFLRGTSLYFTDKVVPMLPSALSNGACSLNAGRDRCCLSAFVRIDTSGELVGCEIEETVINSKVRGVYSEVNDIIECSKASSAESSRYYEKYRCVFDKSLQSILELYRLLEKKSKRKGALELECDEAQIILDADGDVRDIVKRERGDGERLIEQFMLAANEAVANKLASSELPCVYRIHEEPSVEKILQFSTFARNTGLDAHELSGEHVTPAMYSRVLAQAKEAGKSQVVSFVLLRSLMKARYSDACLAHFGLAIDKYCHFTSPIRRYPDLAVHRIIKAALLRTADAKALAALSAYAREAARKSSENEQNSLGAEREIESLYKTLFMMKAEGEEFDGVISSVMPFGVFVTLHNTCEGLIPASYLSAHTEYSESDCSIRAGSRLYKLGDAIRICVENADLLQRRVTFRPAR